MLNNLGEVYVRLKDYRKAEYYYKKALQGDHNNYELIGFCISLANFYIEQSAFRKRPAITFLGPGACRQFGHCQYRCAVYLVLMFEKQKGFKNANSYYKKYYALKRSTLYLFVTKQINELQTKYEFDKKDQELPLANKNGALLETEIKNKERKNPDPAIRYYLTGFSVDRYYLFSAEKKTADLLKKKKNYAIEGLMTEMYHRVKNNFQVLSDIFAIQSAGDYQAGNTAAMQDSKAR